MWVVKSDKIHRVVNFFPRHSGSLAECLGYIYIELCMLKKEWMSALRGSLAEYIAHESVALFLGHVVTGRMTPAIIEASALAGHFHRHADRLGRIGRTAFYRVCFKVNCDWWFHFVTFFAGFSRFRPQCLQGLPE